MACLYTKRGVALQSAQSLHTDTPVGSPEAGAATSYRWQMRAVNPNFWGVSFEWPKLPALEWRLGISHAGSLDRASDHGVASL